jgi:rubredoxin
VRVASGKEVPLKRYRCSVCDHIYDPAMGDPDSNIPPGTPFEKLPDEWVCPDCGAQKSDFAPMAD